YSSLCLRNFRLAYLGLLLFSFRFLCFAHYFCFFPLFSRSFPLSVVPYFALFLSVVFLVFVVRYSFFLAFLFFRYFDCCSILYSSLCLRNFRLAYLGLLLFSFRFLCFAHYFCFFPLFSRSFPLSVVPYFALFLSVVFLVTVVRYSFSLAFLFYRYYDCCPIDD